MSRYSSKKKRIHYVYYVLIKEEKERARDKQRRNLTSRLAESDIRLIAMDPEAIYACIRRVSIVGSEVEPYCVDDAR